MIMLVVIRDTKIAFRAMLGMLWLMDAVKFKKKRATLYIREMDKPSFITKI